MSTGAGTPTPTTTGSRNSVYGTTPHSPPKSKPPLGELFVVTPCSLEDIREVYAKIAIGEIGDKDRPDGEVFRKESVDAHRPYGTIIHSGAIEENRISTLLAQMMGLARSDSIPFLQRVIASSFLFEYSTRSTDGNGRTGRYLLAL